MPSPNMIKLALAAPIGPISTPGTGGLADSVTGSVDMLVGERTGEGLGLGVTVAVAPAVASPNTCSPDLAIINFLVNSTFFPFSSFVVILRVCVPTDSSSVKTTLQTPSLSASALNL